VARYGLVCCVTDSSCSLRRAIAPQGPTDGRPEGALDRVWVGEGERGVNDRTPGLQIRLKCNRRLSPNHVLTGRPVSTYHDVCRLLSGTVARTSVLTGELSLSCARLTDGHVTTLWVNCPLWVSQPGRLSLSSLLGR